MENMKYYILLVLHLGLLASVFGQGNVGVNTNSPLAPLHVNGPAIIESDLIVGDTSMLSPPVKLLYYNDSLSALWYGYVADEDWHPDSMGLYSFAGGAACTAPGVAAVSLGSSNVAMGTSSVAMGNGTTAEGDRSVALGSGTYAQGEQSVAMGHYAQASGQTSIALGYYAEATADRSVALGDYVTARGESSVAMGYTTDARSAYSVAMGRFTEAKAFNSTAIGYLSKANAWYSTAIGYRLNANGYSSTVVGMWNDSLVFNEFVPAETTPLFIVGNGDFMAPSNALVVFKSGLTQVEGQLQLSGGTTLNMIQSGTATIGTNPDGGVKATSITFPNGAFSSAPRVTCTVRGGNFVDTFVVSTRAISTTGFTVNIYRVDNGGGNWGQNLQLDWIAVN